MTRLVIVAYGQPKPKGSLRHVGHGRMVEQLGGSKPWRVAVCEATRTTMDRTFSPILLALRAAPLHVEATITVAKPKSAPKRRQTWPVTRSSGDADKHARNLLDAITDAGLINDDSQVVEVAAPVAFRGHMARLDSLTGWSL